MSEFKFMCPVCSQHIAADASAAGAQIECPTCFQRIIVPEAPKADSKFILSATQCIKPQVVPPQPVSPGAQGAPRKSFSPAILAWLVSLCVVGAAVYVLRTDHAPSDPAVPPPDPAQPTGSAGQNGTWSLNLVATAFPDAATAGKIHDRDFTCERATLQNGSLVLRQGSGQTEVIVSINLCAVDAREPGGKSYNIGTNFSGVTPQIVLRWREGDLRIAQAFTNGYAMKLQLEPIKDDQAPGRIYLCLPDVFRSFVVGTFNAQIKKPSPPKPS
jgi:DNA-directed RNA polymerase subunit RPC12/RpoP